MKNDSEMPAGWEKYCDRCGFALASSREHACVPGDCSQRPLQALDVTGAFRVEVRRLREELKACEPEKLKEILKCAEELDENVEILMGHKEELRTERDEFLDLATCLREERDALEQECAAQAYKGNSVQYWYAKAKAYGGMVHGCAIPLQRSGHPIDSTGEDGGVGGVRRAVQSLIAERDDIEKRAIASVDIQQGKITALEKDVDRAKLDETHWRRKWSEAEARAAGLKEERDEFCETVKQRTKEYEEEIIRIMRERCACEFKDHELVELCKYHGDRERTLREERDLVKEGCAEFEEECNTLRYRVKALEDDASKLAREIGTMQEQKKTLVNERDVAREALAKSRALVQQLNDRLEEARELYAYEYKTNNLANDLADAADEVLKNLPDGVTYPKLNMNLAAFRARKKGPPLTIPQDLDTLRELFKRMRGASGCPEGEDLLEHVASIRTRLELTDDLIPHLESINWREVFMGGRMFKRELVLTPEQKKKLDEDLAAYHLNEPNPHHFGPVNPVSDVRVDGKPVEEIPGMEMHGVRSKEQAEREAVIRLEDIGASYKRMIATIREFAEDKAPASGCDHLRAAWEMAKGSENPNPRCPIAKFFTPFPYAKGGILKDPGITLVGEDRHDDFIPLAGKVEAVPGTAEPKGIDHEMDAAGYTTMKAEEVVPLPASMHSSARDDAPIQDLTEARKYDLEVAERKRRVCLGMSIPGGITGDAELEEQFSHPDNIELEGENILVKPAADDPDVLVVPIKFPSGTATPTEGETVQCAVCGIMFHTELVITMDDVGGPVCYRCQEKENEARAPGIIESDVKFLKGHTTESTPLGVTCPECRCGFIRWSELKIGDTQVRCAYCNHVMDVQKPPDPEAEAEADARVEDREEG